MGLPQVGKSECVCNVCMKGAPLLDFLKQDSFWGAFTCVPPERPLAKRLQLGWSLQLYPHPPSSEQLQVPGFKDMGGLWECSFRCSFSFNSSSRSATQHGVRQELIQQIPHVAALPGEARS